MTKNENLARFAAKQVMGWSPDSAAARDFNPAESWADAGMLWEKAAEHGMYFSLESGYRQWRVIPQQDDDPYITASNTGPDALTKAICRAFGWKGEEDA